MLPGFQGILDIGNVKFNEKTKVKRKRYPLLIFCGGLRGGGEVFKIYVGTYVDSL